MNSKEQKIKEAYGEYYETCMPDENGWTLEKETTSFVYYQDIFEIQEIDKYGFNGEVIGCEKWRPKSLQGIEHNNHWIKIESEDDLPEDCLDAICFLKSYEYEHVGIGRWSMASNSFRTFLGNEYKNVTHYQPIQKPEPPIY